MPVNSTKPPKPNRNLQGATNAAAAYRLQRKPPVKGPASKKK